MTHVAEFKLGTDSMKKRRLLPLGKLRSDWQLEMRKSYSVLHETVLKCTHNQCFEQKVENITIFHLKLSFLKHLKSQYIAYTI